MDQHHPNIGSSSVNVEMLSDPCAASAVHGVEFYEWPLLPASPLYNAFPAPVPRGILVEENKRRGWPRPAMKPFIVSSIPQLAHFSFAGVVSLLLR